MTTPTPEKETDATPGRPKDSGSRQQNHPDQTSHSGSPALDKETAERGEKS